MNVEIVANTPRPVDVLSAVAGMSYGKTNPSEQRLARCIKNKHLSVLEHATVTFRVIGISRACTHQLVRHRNTSFVQLSQRYTRVGTGGSDWYVMPEVFYTDERLCEVYDELMHNVGSIYTKLVELGVHPEDARYVLPEATRSAIVVTMNYRELFHFLKLRSARNAQAEIRDLCTRMLDALSECEDEQVGKMVDLYTEVYTGEE